MPDEIRFPGQTHRLATVGRTGTGKTQAGIWHLSGWDFKTFPWIIWDTKGDPMLKEISRIPGVRHIGFNDKIGKDGLYYLHPLPHEMNSDECEKFLWSIHKHRRVGNFFDEAYMMNQYSHALRAIYTQGRALNLPCITLSQKPKYVTPFTFSEADFFQVFALNDKKDRQRIGEFVPADLETRLPEFHSLWYDVGRDKVREFSPVPARDTILNTFDAKLRHAKRVI